MQRYVEILQPFPAAMQYNTADLEYWYIAYCNTDILLYTMCIKKSCENFLNENLKKIRHFNTVANFAWRYLHDFWQI